MKELLERIRTAVAGVDIKNATLNTEGLVNDVLIVNQELVFRFPRGEWAVAQLEHEARCLELARRHVTAVPLPDWTTHADDFISYPYIPGIALQRNHILGLDEAGQERLAEQLADFLCQLHTIPKEATRAHEIGPSVTVRTVGAWIHLYEEVQRHLFPMMMAYARAWVHHHFAPILDDTGWMDCPKVFMNGDLGPYHLLYEPNRGQLVGIVDFGTAGLGDPATDVACLIDNYGESFVGRMARYYPAISDMIDRARFWAGTLELQWALKGLQSDDPSWRMVHIGRARDVLPIGSPIGDRG